MGELDFRTLPTEDFETKLRIESTFLLICNSCGQKAWIALRPVEEVKNKANQIAIRTKVYRDNARESTKKTKPHLQMIYTRVINFVLSSSLRS